MKYTTIFFDLDDTILDTVKNSKEALTEIYTDYKLGNYFLSFGDFYAKYQSINNNLWDLYEQNLIHKNELMAGRFAKSLNGLVSLSANQSLAMNHDFLARTSSKKNIIEGATEILEYLKQKYEMYVLSNGFTEVQYKKIEYAGVQDYFKGIILSDQVGINKPHPIIFNYALDKANVLADNVVMIGDNINTDIVGAKNAGIDQIWFNPKRVSDTENISPKYEIRSLYELKNIL